VAIDADIVGTLVMSGPGAGGDATASAVAGDIADIAKCLPGEQKVPALGRPATELEPYKRARMRSHEGGYFVRMTVKDMAGVFAKVATAMADQKISLESIVQHADDTAPETNKTIILITHETTEAAARKALEAIGNDDFLVSPPQMIRIEK
jgi:homoserine dehydrogenase